MQEKEKQKGRLFQERILPPNLSIAVSVICASAVIEFLQKEI